MLNLPIKILQTIKIETAQATVTFANIDALVAQWDAAKKVTSRHLVLIVNAASPDAVAKRAVEIQLNGDAGANYNHQTLTGEAAVADADRRDGVNHLFEYPGLTDYPFAIPGTTYANAFGGGPILFPHAFNTTNHKAALGLGGAVEDYIPAVAGRWASNNAITSLVLSPDTGNFATGSIFHLGVIDERYLVEEILDAGGGTFDNIPQGEGDLVIIGYLRTALAAVEDTVICAVNDDTIAGNYPTQEMVGRAGGPPTAANLNFEVGIVSAANATANVFGAFTVVISQYIKDNQPHWLSQSGYHENTGPTGEVRIMSSRRDNIEPINKLYVAGSNFDDFAAGSLLSLYRVPKRLIERQELTAAQATITFDNIPQNFEALILHAYARSDAVAALDTVVITLNGDAVNANYNRQFLFGRGVGVTAARAAATRPAFVITANAGLAGLFDGGSAFLPSYAESDRHKHIMALNGQLEPAQYALLLSARWMNIASVTSISLDLLAGTFLAGSVFELEGILKKEGLPPDEGMLWGV